MSVLSAGTTVRIRRSTAASYLQPQTAQATQVLSWTTSRDGLWTARIGETGTDADSRIAGTIERTAAGFQVRDWRGTVETVHPTLEAAQLSLEPAVRAAARTMTAAIQRRAGLLASSTVVTALVGFTGIIATWIAINPS
ncbi:hypothetical protein [uncultured Amnibacterium sp.]|uniref:hypothetical protein n=1 Tax=uncultured Amnibacterium sp. TaxID=1631851 RepID=UPI0035C9C3F7